MHMTNPSFAMPGLREHLLAAGAGQPAVPVTPALHTPQDHNIDPAIAGHAYAMSGDSGDAMGEARKGRRELSTSKRAAQNRAAQVRRIS